MAIKRFGSAAFGFPVDGPIGATVVDAEADWTFTDVGYIEDVSDDNDGTFLRVSAAAVRS